MLLKEFKVGQFIRNFYEDTLKYCSMRESGKKVKCLLNREGKKGHAAVVRLRPHNHRHFPLKANFYFAFIQRVTSAITIYLLSNHSECSLTRSGPSVVCKVCSAVQRSELNSWKVGCEILTIKLKTEKQSKVLFSVDFIRVSLLLPALSNYLFLLYWGTCPACRCQTVNYFDKISGGCCINWVSLGDFSVTETDLFIAAIMELQSSLWTFPKFHVE